MTAPMGADIVDVLEQAGERYLGETQSKAHAAFLLQVGGTDALRAYDASEAYWERVQAVLDTLLHLGRARRDLRLPDRSTGAAGAAGVPRLSRPCAGRAAPAGADRGGGDGELGAAVARRWPRPGAAASQAPATRAANTAAVIPARRSGSEPRDRRRSLTVHVAGASRSGRLRRAAAALSALAPIFAFWQRAR